MVKLIDTVNPEAVARNLHAIKERVRAAAPTGTDPDSVEIVAATKYVPIELMPALSEGGITLVGENRLQDLIAKQDRWGDMFEWDFIGDLQSRKAPALVGRVRLVHSLGSINALEKMERAAAARQEVLVQVNLSREESKSGITPDSLERFIGSTACNVVGLMTMPPLAAEPESSRKWFADLRELAEQHGLDRLSMGTSQDYEVAVSEGSTMVRIGSALWVEAE